MHLKPAYESHDKEAGYIPELLRLIITSLYKLGKTSEALIFLDNELMMGAGSADLYYLKGIICQDLGLYAPALSSLRRHSPVIPILLIAILFTFIESIRVNTYWGLYPSILWIWTVLSGLLL